MNTVFCDKKKKEKKKEKTTLYSHSEGVKNVKFISVVISAPFTVHHAPSKLWILFQALVYSINVYIYIFFSIFLSDDLRYDFSFYIKYNNTMSAKGRK